MLVLRHLKPVDALLKPPPSICWAEGEVSSTGVVVQLTRSCAELALENRRRLAAGSTWEHSWKQAVTGLCFTSCGRGNKVHSFLYPCFGDKCSVRARH